ncbi:uncharacterized protein LOC110976893 [Acanthaster planci]|uniref:Uncharacterized protein LOC110976893 n=1 Tax=Acanthaster planci TaxID=133434 RepID=A0A8B7Y1W0_ACAPL|nr:uncharacterized protein LOC110976893 [Acanthaster planci]XP_022086281.1 uncharacterized protein LOC110976893 [Acanthaster planci]
MFAAKLKINARKSTHSGKVHLGTPSFQDRHWQDASSYSPTAAQDRTAGEKSSSSSASKSKERTVWDTKFTQPEPVHPESTDDVIWVSTRTTVAPKSCLKQKVKEGVSSLEPQSKPDRNIFSALGKPVNTSKRVSDKRPSAVDRGSFMPHQSSSASRSLSCPGKSSSEFVFKKPTAPPPFSRTHMSLAGSGNRKQKLSSSITTQDHPQQGNNLKSGGSVTSTAKAHAGGKNKRPQCSISLSELSKSDGIIPILERKEIFTPKSALSGLKSSIDSSLNLELGGKCKMKLSSRGQLGKGKLQNSGQTQRKSTGKPGSGNLGKKGERTESSFDAIESGFHKLGDIHNIEHCGGLGDIGDLGGLEETEGEFGGLGELGGYCNLAGLEDIAGFDDVGDEMNGLEEIHRCRELEKHTSMSLNARPKKSMGVDIPHSTLSSKSHKISTARVVSSKPCQTTDKFHPRLLKTIHTKSTSRKSVARGSSLKVVTNGPAVKKSSVSQNASTVAKSHVVIDLCKPSSSRKSVGTRVRSTAASPHRHGYNSQLVSHLQPNISTAPAMNDDWTQVQKKGSTGRLQSSHKCKSSTSRKDVLTSEISGISQKTSDKCRSQNIESKSSSSVEDTSNAHINKKVSEKITNLDKPIVPLERLEIRLSPMKIQSGGSWEQDEIDGVLFTSFSTQYELESYLKMHPQEMSAQQGTGTCCMPSQLQASSPAGSRPPNHQNKVKQLEQQLTKYLRSSACNEVLHPRLVRRGLSIRRDLIGNRVNSINLRVYGIRWESRNKKGVRKSSKRNRLTGSKRLKPFFRTACKMSPIKNCSATPTTGLKIKFTMPRKDSKEVKESKVNTEPPPGKHTELSVAEAESATEKTVQKMPPEESIPFKPFEKEVLSSKSAFVSDALDKYLLDLEKQSSTVTSPSHPLLQSKASSVTFKMPSKQSSYIKTLDTALKERQMAKNKCKVPTVAETAQKLANNLKHTSAVFKLSDPQSSPVEKESLSSSVKALSSDSIKAGDTELPVQDQTVKPDHRDVQINKVNISPKSRRKDAYLEEKKRFLEERLESVKKKLKESTAFLKKIPNKSKSQTSWATKLKIVNSRLVQQLNSPGQNAHLIKAKEAASNISQRTGIQIKTERDATANDHSSDSEHQPSVDAKSGKVTGRGKSKVTQEFVRLDQQTTCNKDFCRLGCVCESINLNLPVERLTKHCRKADCMFDCTCQRNNIRILRNRKRPTIFQEKSMLFYDGVGMFSNSNVGFVEEPTSPLEEREKPGILSKSGVGTCARATMYKPKPKHQPKETKIEDTPSKLVSGNPQEKQQVQRAVSTEPEAAPQQSLPKQDPSISHLQIVPKTPFPMVKQETAQSQKGRPPNTSESSKAVVSETKAGEVVPSVLYAPLQVPLSGKKGTVVLYAPISTLPYMVQKVPVVANLQQTSSMQAAAVGKPTPVSALNSEPSVQVTVNSDPKIHNNKVKPVAVISPTSASQTDCDKTPVSSTAVSVQDVHSVSPGGTEDSWRVCKISESGQLGGVFKMSSHETVTKHHACIKEVNKLLNKSSEMPANVSATEKEEERGLTVTCPKSTTCTENDLNGSVCRAEGANNQESESSEKHTNTTISSSSLQEAKELTKVTESSTFSDSQKPKENVSSELTKKLEISAATEQNQVDNPTSATKSSFDSTSTSATEHPKTVSTSGVQVKEVSQDTVVALNSVREKISAVVTKIKSPVGSPTTSPTAGSSHVPLNLVKANKLLNQLSVSETSGAAVADTNKKLNSISLSLPKVIPTNPNTTVSMPGKALKVSAFSNTAEQKGIEANKPKLTKTQVFLPGSSMSAINTKNSSSSARSPLLIEIQSECNWSNTKNDILSSIAKHTSKGDGAPGVIRVGKFLVEILSKEEQKNVAVSINTSTFKEGTPLTVAATSSKTIERTTPFLKTPITSPLQLPGLKQPATKPGLGTHGLPSNNAPLTDFKKFTFLPSNPVSKGMNFAKAGTITTAVKPSSAPLLTSLPPGSILLSDGKKPSGYLVPLKAVQDQLKGSSSAASRDPVAKQPPSLSTPSSVNGASGVPTTVMPRLGPIGSVSSQNITTAGSSSELSLSNLQKAPNIATQASAVLTITSPTANSQTQAVTLTTSTASYRCTENTGKAFAERSEISRTPTSLNPVKSNLGQITTEVPAIVPVSESHVSNNQHGPFSKDPDPLKLQDAIFRGGTPEGTHQLPPSEASQPEVPTEAPDCAIDSDEFVDVESLDGVQPISLLSKKHKPHLLKPKPASPSPPIFPVALTSDVPQPPTTHVIIAPKSSRRKMEHKMRPSLLSDDPVEEIDVGTYMVQSQGPDKFSFGKTTPARFAAPGVGQPGNSRRGKRKRKSPVIQQSVMALEEPEFIESYYEVSSGEDDKAEDEPKRFKRDKPNKVLHLIKERQRRRDQSDLFGGLKFVLLNDKDTKVSKVSLLAKAFEEIKQLEFKAFEIEVQETRLKQENYQKRSKLASLLDLNILDFPSPITGQQDCDFADYIGDLNNGSDGMASTAQSETTSQDSESVDMDTSDDDADRADCEEGITREQYEQMMGLQSQAPKVKPCNSEKEELTADVSSDKLLSQTLNSDLPLSSWQAPARHPGLPETVPGASTVARVVPKSKPATNSKENCIGVPSKHPVPVALTALPFDLHKTNPSTDPEVTIPMPDVDLLMEVSSGNVSPDPEEKLMEYRKQVDSNSPPSNTTEVLPVQSSSGTSLPANEVGSPTPADHSANHCNQTGSVDTSCSRVQTKASSEVEIAINDADQSTLKLTESLNRSSDASHLSLSASGGDASTTVVNKTAPQDEISVLSSTEDEPMGNVSDLKKLTKDIEKVQSEDTHNSVVTENSSCVYLDRDKEDEVTQTDLPSTSKGDDFGFVLHEEPSINPSLGDKQSKAPGERQGSPYKSNPSRAADSKAACPAVAPVSANPANLSVVSIETRGGVVRVTCNSGEIIPLAVVKASADGTMQVAVEGDISSEKVEELLSKSEVMECLEKVADSACEKLES